MRKICFLLAVSCLVWSQVQVGINVGPDGQYYYDDGYYYDTWYGPGYYNGFYFNNYGAYYGWRGNRWNRGGHWHGGGHGGHHGGHGGGGHHH